MINRILLSLTLIFSTTFLTLNAQNWNEIIKATASDASADDTFGYSVAIDGDYAIVGAPGNDDNGGNSGSAYLLIRFGSTWTEQAKLTASDPGGGDQFGISVAIDGDYAIVGASFDQFGRGSAYIFIRSGNVWSQQAKLTASDPSNFDLFAGSVAIEGDNAIIGARGNDDGGSASGSAYIFTRIGSVWIEDTKLIASDDAANDEFGSTVSISGDYAIVGAPFNSALGSASGAAYIFMRSAGVWTEQAKLSAFDTTTPDRFGSSVAIDGDYTIIGAVGNADAGGFSGSAYIFSRSGIIWTEQVKLIASDADTNDEFGLSVAIDGDNAIIGARGNADAGPQSGSAYIFSRSGSIWTEQTKLTASDSAATDNFSFSVSIGGDIAIVGARYTDDLGSNSGSAYFFEKEIVSVTYTFDNGWLPSDPNGNATADDDLIVASGDAIINTNTTCNSVTINPGAGLIIDSGVTLTATNGVLLESSSTSYSSLILDGSVIGTLTYERHVNINGSGTTGSNDLVSAPLTGQDFSSFAAANPNILNNGSLFLFGPFEKATGQYVNWASTESATLDPGVGYRAATSDNSVVTFTGIANNGNFINNISNSGPIRQEWNLVGNPYPSYLNVQDFLNHDVGGVTNIQLFDAPTAAIYGYDGNALNGWTVYNLATTSVSTRIAPGQGFFVSADATNDDLYDLEFTPAMRSTGTGDDFIQGRNAQLVYLKLGLNSNSINSITDFYFNPNASQGLDVGYDAEVFENANLYSHLIEDNTGKQIALQALNSTDVSNVSIPLGVSANQGEQIRFSISESTLPDSVLVFLDDVLANTSTLLNDGDYVITPTTDLSGTGRFYLRTSEEALSTAENSFDTLNIFALNSSKEIVVTGQLLEATTLELYDIQGRVVLSVELDNSVLENRVDSASLSAGVYVVRIENNMQQKSQKVILK